MPDDKAVLDALQTLHDLEASASEKWHKQEHCFKNTLKKYHGLGKWFDRRHKEAFCRQHDLRKQIMRMGGYVATNLGDTDYTDDVLQAFKDACATLNEIMDGYAAVNEAAKAAGDKDTREALHGYFHDLKKIYQKGEQAQQQITDIGLSGFLATQL